MRRSSLVALALAAFAGRALAAAPLSLAQARALARAHSPEGAELAARFRAAEETSSAASHLVTSNPTLIAEYGTGALTGGPEEYQWGVGVSQTFDLSGSWFPRAAAASADRERAVHEREEGLLALDEAVAVAVADLAIAQRRSDGAAKIAALLSVSSEAARRQLQVGQGTQLDVDAADLDLWAAHADNAQADAELQSRAAALARLIGRGGSEDLRVEDPAERVEPIASSPLWAAVDADPRVRAAEAELRAARLWRAVQGRKAWPEVTLGVAYGARQQDIPQGSFQGAGGAPLTALWSDSEVGVRLELPVPLFDRRFQERAESYGRELVAEAVLAKARADTRLELQRAWSSLRSAEGALKALSGTPAVIEREFKLLDQALRSGALDSVARAVALKRLQEAGARHDTAVRDLRVARARWVRWSRAP